jgi:hypothetical protein
MSPPTPFITRAIRFFGTVHRAVGATPSTQQHIANTTTSSSSSTQAAAQQSKSFFVEHFPKILFTTCCISLYSGWEFMNYVRHVSVRLYSLKAN